MDSKEEVKDDPQFLVWLTRLMIMRLMRKYWLELVIIIADSMYVCMYQAVFLALSTLCHLFLTETLQDVPYFVAEEPEIQSSFLLNCTISLSPSEAELFFPIGLS